MTKARFIIAAVSCIVLIAIAVGLNLHKPVAPLIPTSPAPVAQAPKPQPVTLSDVPDEVARASVAPKVPQPQATQPDPPGMVITGQAFTADGKPASGAVIAAYSADTGAIQAAATEEGKFRVVGLRPGSYRVSANLEHYNEAVQEGVAAGATGVKLVLDPMSAVEGRVLRAQDNEPIQKFEVLYLKTPPTEDLYWQNVIRDETTQWTQANDPDGKYRIEDIVSGADFAVAVRAEGYEPAFAVVPAAASGETAAAPDVLLQPEARIEGRVLSSKKEPVAGANIYFGKEARGRHAAISNEEGAFTITQLPAGPLTFSASHRDYLPGLAETTAVAGQTTKLDIVLGSGGSVRGTLLNGATPLSGQPVSATRLAPPKTRKQVVTDAQGAYTIEGLPPGDVEVIAKAVLDEQNPVPIRLQKTAAIEDGQATTIDFQYADATSGIEGLITVAGQPATVAFVKGFVAGASGDSFFNTSVKSDGSYTIQNLPSGSAWLEVTVEMDDGHERRKNIPVEVPRGQTVRQDIRLDGAATILGKVANLGANEGGEVIAVEGEYVFDPAQADVSELDRVIVASCPIESDGAFKLTGLDAGTYSIIVIAFDPDQADGTGQMPTVRSKTERVTLAAGQQLALNPVIP